MKLENWLNSIEEHATNRHATGCTIDIEYDALAEIKDLAEKRIVKYGKCHEALPEYIKEDWSIVDCPACGNGLVIYHGRKERYCDKCGQLVGLKENDIHKV